MSCKNCYYRFLKKIQKPETIGILNIFTLRSPNPELQKKLTDQQLSSANRFTELAFTLACLAMLNNLLQLFNGGANALVLIVNNSLVLVSAVVWFILKYRFKLTPIFLVAI